MICEQINYVDDDGNFHAHPLQRTCETEDEDEVDMDWDQMMEAIEKESSYQGLSQRYSMYCRIVW